MYPNQDSQHAVQINSAFSLKSTLQIYRLKA